MVLAPTGARAAGFACERETVRCDDANAAKTTDNAKNGDAVNPSKTNGEEPDCDGNPPKTEKAKRARRKTGREKREKRRGERMREIWLT